jgi:hypothetical protein
MNEAELKARALSALEAFQQADRYHLEHDLSERCIAARVAFHLQNILSDCPALRLCTASTLIRSANSIGRLPSEI